MRKRYGICKSFMSLASFYNGILELEDSLIADIGEKPDYIGDTGAQTRRSAVVTLIVSSYDLYQ